MGSLTPPAHIRSSATAIETCRIIKNGLDSVYIVWSVVDYTLLTIKVGEVCVDESSLTQMGCIMSQVKDKTNIFYCKTKPSPSSNSEYLPSYHHKSWPAGAHV